jgi:DNA repair exonuclease SbcCD ATPase subunit
MKFIHLRIANYRGITASEVKFASDGITLVQGPNEAGKSSLGEAIGLLFECPDSSKNRNMEAIRPVHRDEGPEIELQAESGPYAFTYFKRFYKKPQTKLTIARPKPENLTGREAHERAEGILRETLDIDLWKALAIQQGDAIQQPVLTKQISLSAALDKAAGGRPADPREEGLFGRVRDEYGRYFTERGAEKKELHEARKLREDTKAEVVEVEQRIHDLERDIEREASLQRKLGQLRTQEEELAQAVLEHNASLEEIGILENAYAAARLKLESVQKSEEMMHRDKDARQGLIDEVVKATKTHKELKESSSMSLPALNQAEDELKNAQESFDAADRRRKEVDILAALRREDFDYYNNKLNLEQLRERKERIDQARKTSAQAQDVLARNKVTSRVLKAIQEAEQDLSTAKAKLETGAPHVLLHGLGECSVIIDGADTTLGKGDNRDLSIADSLRLTIPRKLDIEVTAGTSSEKLQKKVDEAQRTLESACKNAGVVGPDEARKAFEDRREASRQVENKGQVEADNLRDLTYDELDGKLARLRQSVPAYLAGRPKKPTICADLDSAKREWTSADTDQRKANREWETTREGFDSARNIRDGLKAKHQEERVQLEMVAKNLEQAQGNLARARKSNPDDVLDTTLADAVRAVALEESSVETADASLKVKNPERVRALAETAKGSLTTTQNQRSVAQTELTEVLTRLKLLGEEGLHEKLHAMQVHLERVETSNKALFGRASSAKCLFDIIREEREKARRAYVAPLKEKIEHLGRLVFDDSFQVDISEDLQIASRTANGVTVPFDSLSGGTKEQLSLIFRLACSMIVAKDGGTPLILDDALGYTDPDRLRLMGAVLAKAAKDCQIVIFTCVPDRYSNIGEATVVSLG